MTPRLSLSAETVMRLSSLALLALFAPLSARASTHEFSKLKTAVPHGDYGYRFVGRPRTKDFVLEASVKTTAAGPAGGTVAAPTRQDVFPAGPALFLVGDLAGVLAGMFGRGLLLAFTPCILPMVPILSGMIARSGQELTPGRGLALSGSYVLAMAGIGRQSEVALLGARWQAS